MILDEAIEELLTEFAKKEVKLQLQRIRRDEKKKVDVEKLPDAPGESCAGCWEWVDRMDRYTKVRDREEKVWDREREVLERELAQRDREIAWLTEVAEERRSLLEDLQRSSQEAGASQAAPPVAEPPAPSPELNEYGDVGFSQVSLSPVCEILH